LRCIAVITVFACDFFLRNKIGKKLLLNVGEIHLQFAKKLQSQALFREKLRKALSYEKGAHKMLVKFNCRMRRR